MQNIISFVSMLIVEKPQKYNIRNATKDKFKLLHYDLRQKK